MTFSARSPAKVNLTLEVGAPRDDGFHPLRSVFLRIGLSDRLTVREWDGERDRLTVSGPVACPVEGNLVLRAASLLRQRAGLPLPPLEWELEKHIPLGGGLAGGSADAATALALAATCWGVGLSAELRLELAAAVGSDVPFFTSGAPAALVEGRGEQVRPLPAPAGRPGILLITPPFEVSTAAAFARLDTLAGERDRPDPTDELAAGLEAGLDPDDLVGWAERLRDANDLWPAAALLEPALGDVRGALESGSGRAWLMSGSGSSLFSFYPSPDEAAEAGRRLAADLSGALARARLYATDLAGPDPIWRQP